MHISISHPLKIHLGPVHIQAPLARSSPSIRLFCLRLSATCAKAHTRIYEIYGALIPNRAAVQFKRQVSRTSKVALARDPPPRPTSVPKMPRSCGSGERERGRDRKMSRRQLQSMHPGANWATGAFEITIKKGSKRESGNSVRKRDKVFSRIFNFGKGARVLLSRFFLRFSGLCVCV